MPTTTSTGTFLRLASNRDTVTAMETTQCVTGETVRVVPTVPKSVAAKAFQYGWNGFDFYLWRGELVAVRKAAGK